MRELVSSFFDFVVGLLDFLTIEGVVPIISMVPLIELRGSIPFGIYQGLTPFQTFLLAYPASMIPAPFIILLIKKIFDLLSKYSTFFDRLIERIIRRNNEKHREKVDKYGLMGLFIIVAIPLPGTGVWSGSLAASLFDFKFKSALVIIALGNLVAASAITLISIGAFSFI